MDGVNGPYNYFHGDRKVVVSRVEDSRGKRFPQQGWSLEDDNGRQRWIKTDAKNFHALYCGGDHEDWLLNLPVRSTIFIVEGEKDVINMRMAGMNAVSAIGGAERGWKKSYCDYLASFRVHIIVDHDKPGFKFGRSAHDCLVACGVSVDGVWRTDSGFGSKEDVSDVLDSDAWSDGYEGNLRDLLVPCLEELPGGRSGAAGESKGQPGGRAKRALRLVSDGEDVDWLNKALEHMREEDSSRHDTMLWLACRLRDNTVPTGEMCMVDGNEEKEAIEWFNRFQKEVDDPDDPFVYEEELKKFREIFQSEARPADGEQDNDLPEFLPAGYKMPSNWRYRNENLEQFVASKTNEGEGHWLLVCFQCPWITARVVSGETGKHSRELRWADKQELYDYERLVNPAKLISLSSDGLGVHAGEKGNTAKMVRYFVELEQANIDVLPLVSVSERIGWQKDGSFRYRASDGSFHPDLHPVLERYSTKGTYEEWLQIVSDYSTSEGMVIGVLAALVAPLLNIVGCPPFTVDFSGESSTGKSTILHMAASVWGNPNQVSKGGLLNSWVDTANVIARESSCLWGLPAFRDDTASSRSADDVSEILRAVSEGKTRSRGTRDGGINPGIPWQAMLITSGEQAITSFDNEGGTKARTVRITKNRLLHPPGHNGRTLNNRIRAHYGHAGQRLMGWLLGGSERDQERRRRDKLEQPWKENSDRLTQHAESDITRRRAQYVAMLQTGAGLFGVQIDLRHLVHNAEYWDGVNCGDGSDITDDDMPLKALMGLIQELSANKSNKFWRISQSRNSVTNEHEEYEHIEPNGGWWGRWDDGEASLPMPLVKRVETILFRDGHSWNEMKKPWLDRGWIKTSPGNGYQFRAQMWNRNKQEPCVCLTAKALEVYEKG